MSKKWVIVFTMAAMAAMLVGAGSGFAFNYVWNGASGDWGTGANWDDGIGGHGVPGVGDNAKIVGGITQPTIGAGGGTCLNLEIDTSAGAVTLTLTNDLALSAGGTITVSAGALASNISGGGDLVQGGASTITNNSTGLFTIGCGQITCTGATLTTFTGTGNTTVTANIIEGGGTPITKSGNGTLALNGANTFIGVLTINAGTVELGNISAFGSGAGGITMAGGILKVTVAINAGNWDPLVTLTGNAAIQFAAAGTTIDTAIDVAGTKVLTIQGNSAATLTGGITGAGGVTINMDANQVIAITSAAWAYTGNTTITNGFITTNAAHLLTNSGTYTFANDADAKITTGGVETIGSLAGGGTNGGNVVMGGAMTIAQAANTTYSGIISGNTNVLTKTGVGTLKLAGANTYDDATNVTAGTLLVNAVQGAGCVGAVTVSGAGTILGGTGTIRGAVTIGNGAFLKPGDDDNAPATLTATGAFTFSNGSTLIVDVAGAATDLLAVTGALSVGGTSEIDLGVVPSSQAIQYTVVTSGSGAALFQTTNLNAGWSQSTNGTTFIKLLGVASAGSIPTLNEWGIIIMFLLLTGTSILVMRKRQRTSGIDR